VIEAGGRVEIFPKIEQFAAYRPRADGA
jgi:hypothetical protein